MTTWMNVDDIMQNVITQSQQDKYFMTNLQEAPKIIKHIEAKNRMVVAMGWMEGHRRQCQSTGIKFQYSR